MGEGAGAPNVRGALWSVHAALGWNRRRQGRETGVVMCCSQRRARGGGSSCVNLTGEKHEKLHHWGTHDAPPARPHARQFRAVFACQLKTHILTQDPRDAADRRLLSARKLFADREKARPCTYAACARQHARVHVPERNRSPLRERIAFLMRSGGESGLINHSKDAYRRGAWIRTTGPPRS